MPSDANLTLQSSVTKTATFSSAGVNLKTNPSTPRRGMRAKVQYSAANNGGAATTITAATNASPIVITSTAHGYVNGNVVTITGVNGNTAANGTWVVSGVTTNTYNLTGSVGSGAYTSGGTGVVGNTVLFNIDHSPDNVNFFPLAYQLESPYATSGIQGLVLNGTAQAGEVNISFIGGFPYVRLTETITGAGLTPTITYQAFLQIANP